MGVLEGPQIGMSHDQYQDPNALGGILFEAAVAANANFSSGSSSGSQSDLDVSTPKNKKRKREE